MCSTTSNRYFISRGAGRLILIKTSHQNELQPGHVLHWYRIDQLIGRGGFGITYLATDENLQEKVAVKEYYPAQYAIRTAGGRVRALSARHDEDFHWGRERFVTEARTLTQFRHPAIVRVRNVFEANQTAYMVMDYIEGENLEYLLKREQTLSEQTLLSLIMPLMDGLELVHESGFIHRDIKPANIIVSGTGAVLVDFGSARQAVGERSISLTQIVSPGYAPFEQYQSDGEQQGPWTDIYALGATLYRVIVGKAPPQAIDRSKALLETSRDLYVSVLELCKTGYSEQFLQAVDHALAFQAANRPQLIGRWKKEFPGSSMVSLVIPDSEIPTDLFDINGKWSAAEKNKIMEQLERVLAGHTFATAGQLQRLLRYLVAETLAGRGKRLNQTCIAVDVLGRDERFDPAIDAVVRVEARRLRSRLIEYYYSEGVDDAIRFDLPKGSYVPVITFGPVPDRTGVARAVDSIKSVSYKIRAASRYRLPDYLDFRILVAGIFGLLILLIVILMPSYVNRNSQNTAVTGNQVKTETIAIEPVVQKQQPKSIAVLPFADYSAPEENVGYFADGIAEEILNRLTRVEGLRVAGRTSSFYFKDKHEEPRVIGRTLGVSHILEGGVTRDGGRIRITAQLINVEDGFNVWSETFDHSMEDIFAIEDEISKAIAGVLELKLLTMTDPGTDKPEAYTNYIAAFSGIMSQEDINTSREAQSRLDKAIEIDPAYGQAYALRAFGTMLLYFNDQVISLDEMRNAVAGDIARAQALVPDSAMVHLIKGFLADTVNNDPDEAEIELQRAAKLNPRLAEAQVMLGRHYLGQGRIEQADAAFGKALAIDPLYRRAMYWSGVSYDQTGRNELAGKVAHEMLTYYPNDPGANELNAELLEKTGRLADAALIYEKYLVKDPDFDFQSYLKLGNLLQSMGADKELNERFDVTSKEPWIDDEFKVARLVHAKQYSEAADMFRKLMQPEHIPAYAGYTSALYAKAGRYKEIIDLVQVASPGMFDGNFRKEEFQFYTAIYLAHALRMTGDEQRARTLGQAALSWIEDNPIAINSRNEINPVLAHLAAGENEQAISSLDRLYRSGWRNFYYYHQLASPFSLFEDPLFETLLNDSRIRNLIADYRKDMARQLAIYREKHRIIAGFQAYEPEL